jgi:transcriptional regulator with XRE-family HTH domain
MVQGKEEMTAGDTAFEDKASEETSAAPKEGKAILGIRALRSQLADENPAYAAAVEVEDDAESFCREVRAKLRKERKGRSLDQTAVAELLDMTQSAVSKIESGEGDIGMKTVFRYAHALGLIPVCTFMADSRRLFSDADVATAKAVQTFQTGLVKDTSEAVSSAVADFARSFAER